MNCVIYKQEIFTTNSSIHNINTRNERPLHRPIVNLTYFQKCTFYAGIKFFNTIPPTVIILKSDKANFKAPFGKYLHIHIHTHIFYFVGEFFMRKNDL